MTHQLAVSALDKPLAFAFKLGIFGVVLGVILFAFGTLSGKPKVARFGFKLVLVGLILWGITMLYVFSWFF